MSMLLLLSCKIFSQQDSTVRISKRHAILTIQDLIRYDGLKVTDSLVREQLNDYKRITLNYERIVSGFEEKERNYQLKEKSLQALSDNSELAYKNQVKRNRLLKVIIVGLIGYAGYSTFK